MARALGSYPGCRWFKSDCRYHFYGPLVKRLRHRPFTAESWVRFPYGSPHYDTPKWLYRAVWECFFLYGFWSWSLFGLYCKATKFSLLFEIFDFGNSRGSYFEFMVFKQEIRLFRRPAFLFLSKISASAIARLVLACASWNI